MQHSAQYTYCRYLHNNIYYPILYTYIILLYTYTRARGVSSVRSGGVRRSAATLVEKIRHPAWRWHRRIDHGPAARLLLSSAMIARLPPPHPSPRQYSQTPHGVPPASPFCHPVPPPPPPPPGTTHLPGRHKYYYYMCTEREACRRRCRRIRF